ncbi:MAG: hypothetical protein MJ176_07875 [Treponema sp.]|nr:hypothetical protein [Treponema sp.]
MKKIVSIVAALAMATAMFANPVMNINVVDFNGSASVSWGIDLDRGTTGFKNDTDVALKIHFLDEGTKATSSDASVWGEIEIKAGGVDVEKGGSFTVPTPSVEKAILHIGPAWVGIKAGHTTVGGFEPVLATRSTDGTNKWGAVAAVGTDATQGITVGYKMDNVFSAEVDFRSLQGTPWYADPDAKTSWGDKYSDKYAASIKVTFDMVENLGVALGVSKDFTVDHKLQDGDESDIQLFGKVEYKLGLTDKFYLKPQVAATWAQGKIAEPITGITGYVANTEAVAAVLFGWGAEKQGTNIKYIEQKVSDGASVALRMSNVVGNFWGDDKNNAKLNTFMGDVLVGVWDSATLVPNLTFGAELLLENAINTAKVEGKVFDEAIKYKHKETVDCTPVKTITAEAKYAIDLDGKTITPKVAVVFHDDLVKVSDKNQSEYELNAQKFYCGVDFDGFVPYTTFSVDYETAEVCPKGYMYKGHLDFTCKISF